MIARLLLLVLLCAPLPAAAAPCHVPDLVATFPPEGATGVPTDATLFAAYAPRAEYVNEEVLLIPAAGDPRPLAATWARAEALLAVKPPDGLEPGATYTVRWPALRSLDAATPGLGREVRFTAGAGADLQEPVFGGVAAVAWDLERERNECTDEIEERFLFDLSLAPAADDGGSGSLRLLVFQSAGPGLAQPKPVWTGPLPATGPLRVALPPSTTTGRVCFAALVSDLTGKHSASASTEACVQTTAPPFFRGCAAAPAGPGGAAPIPLATLLLLLARRRRRRREPR